jgi:hypothetical protein
MIAYQAGRRQPSRETMFIIGISLLSDKDNLSVQKKRK